MFPMIHGIAGAAGLGAVTRSFRDSYVYATNTQNHTFSSCDIGTAASDRHVVVAIFISASTAVGTISSVTIGGVSASELVTSASAEYRVSFYIAAVPTGTTGDVVINTSKTETRFGIGVWAVYGASATAHDTGSSTADPLTDNINIAAGGVAIGVGVSSRSSPEYTWTNLTEDYEEVVESPIEHTGASAEFSTQQSALALTCDPDGSGGQHAGAFISLEPA